MTTSFLRKGMTILVAACLASAAYCNGTATWTDGNGVTWTFSYDELHVATITGIEGEYPSHLVIPECVYVGSAKYWVNKIGISAFDCEYHPGCAAITSVTLNDNVTEIGAYAFYECANLASVSFGYGGEGAGLIGSGAFAKTGLTRVMFLSSNSGGSEWSIKSLAFNECTSLDEVIFNNPANSRLYVESDAFKNTPFANRVNVNDNWADAIALTGTEGSVTGCNIAASVESDEPKVYPGAKTGDNSLWWKWTAPAGVTQAAFTTHDSDFGTCLSVYTGTTVDSLGGIDSPSYVNYSYDGIPVVFAVTPGDTYSIRVQGGNYGACGNIKLSWRTARAEYGFSLVVMEDGTLTGFLGTCPETLVIPDGVTAIGESAFNYGRNGSVENLKHLEVPDHVTSIGICAFYNCPNLVSATLGGGVESIERSAFDGCAGLASITFGENLKAIGDQAFRKTALTDVRIPYGVESIGWIAFYACGNLKSALLPSRFKGNLDPEVFKDCPADLVITYYDEVKYAGVADAKFAKAQTVRGALYDAAGRLAGTMEVKFGKKGKKGVKVKATATLMNGKKIGSKPATLNGTTATLAFKSPVGTMTLAMISEGMFSLKNAAYETAGGSCDLTTEGATLSRRSVKVGGKMPVRTMFFNGAFDPSPSFGAGMSRVEAALPSGVKVAVNGAKWTVAKAKTLKYVKVKEGGSVRYDLPIAAGENVAALKLAYAYKTGMFKGSFKMYATNAGAAKPKLKKYTVKAIGFVVDDRGTGEATLKKPAGAWPVTVKE